MRKTLIAATLVTAGVFSTDYVIGQLQGTSLANAASKRASNGTTRRVKPAQASGTATPRTPHADGTVTAVSGNTITVKPDNDSAGSNEYTQVTTIVLTSSTTYKSGTTRAAIVVGANIVAEGTVSSDGKTLTATSVGVGGHGGKGGHAGPHADGSVVGISGNTVTVKADTDQAGSNEYTKVTTVLLTNSTTYGPSTTKASIVAGAQFDAEGTLSSDGTTLTATRFDVRSAGTGPHGQFGH